MEVQRRNCVFSRENIYLNNNRSINLNYILNVVNNNYDGGCCVMRKKLGKVFGIIFVVLMIFSFNFNVKAEEVVSEVTENSEPEVKETVKDSVSKEESNAVVKKEEVKNDSLTSNQIGNLNVQNESGKDVVDTESIDSKKEEVNVTKNDVDVNKSNDDVNSVVNDGDNVSNNQHNDDTKPNFSSSHNFRFYANHCAF